MSTLTRGAFPVAFLAVFVAVGLPAVVVAQCPPPPSTSPLAEGEIGLFFDVLGTETCANIGVGVTPLYVVARVPEGGVAQFDAPELLTAALPPGLTILGTTGLPPAGYDALIVIDGCDQFRRSDPASCPVAQGDLMVLSMTEVFAVTPITASVCFQTACPTIAGTVAGPPTYFRCDTGDPGAFAGWEAMCIGFGQAPVPVESSTWGAIKALYDE
jgi:hypothetical protein